MELLFLFIGLVTGIIFLLVYKRYAKAKIIAQFENEKRIFQLVESSKDIIYYFQVVPAPHYKYLSPSIEKVLSPGLVEESYENPFTVYDRIHPDDYKTLYNKLHGQIDYTKPIIQRWKNDNGVYIYFEEYATPIYENGEFVAVQGIIRNIDEKVKLQEDLEYRITHDALTGIYNREFFEQQMEKYSQLVDVPIGIILCDLDELKSINDKYGHKAGDKLIKESAVLLDRFSSKNCIVSRIGGDEYAILVIHTNDNEVKNLAKSIITSLFEYNSTSIDVNIRLSVGYTYSDYSVGNMNSLFVEADKKMYEQKNNKK